jgi:1-acyl-sn-glycerol-3-phosphate acyltransferase
MKVPAKAPVELPFPFLKMLSWCIVKPFFSFEVRGLHHLQSINGPIILAGNHTGFLDAPMLLAATNRYFHFIMTEEVFDWGLLGHVVRFGNIIPLYKGKEKRTLVDIVRKLKTGSTVCIFPEGKLTQDGKLNPFNEGAAFLQEKSGVPIIPFTIYGGFEAWPQTKCWPIFRKIILQFGEPIEPKKNQDRKRITETLKEKIQTMKDALEETTNTVIDRQQPERNASSVAEKLLTKTG